jgi:hypothetical protein
MALSAAVLADVVFLVALDNARRHLALADKCIEWCDRRGPNRMRGSIWESEARRHTREANHWAGLAEAAAKLLTSP